MSYLQFIICIIANNMYLLLCLNTEGILITSVWQLLSQTIPYGEGSVSDLTSVE